MSECPLLLQYKIRNTHDCSEIRVDMNKGECIEYWKRYDEPKYGMWKLQLPDSEDFLTSGNGDVQYFSRWEIQLIGDPDPVVIRFSDIEYLPDRPVQIYRLPSDYTNIEKIGIFIFGDSRTRSLLQEFERCRDQWEPRVFVRR